MFVDGVMIRSLSVHRASRSFLRITVGLPADNARCLDTLRAALGRLGRRVASESRLQAAAPHDAELTGGCGPPLASGGGKEPGGRPPGARASARPLAKPARPIPRLLPRFPVPVSRFPAPAAGPAQPIARSPALPVPALRRNVNALPKFHTPTTPEATPSPQARAPRPEPPGPVSPRPGRRCGRPRRAGRGRGPPGARPGRGCERSGRPGVRCPGGRRGRPGRPRESRRRGCRSPRR